MEFKKVKYKKIGKIKSGKRLPKGFSVTEKITNNKYIRVRDLNNNILDLNNIQYITDEACSYIKDYRVREGDIIISVVGTIGNIVKIPKELDGAYLTENCNNLIVDEKICLKEYLKYYLVSDYGKNEINTHIVGSTQPKLPIYGIQDFNIILPSIKHQMKIIKILNSLDKKIELNNQINDNLFNIIKSIYEQYFLSNSEYLIKTISELNLDISDGNYSSKYPTKSEFLSDGIPFIRGTDFLNRTINKSSMVYISEEKHKELKKGHLKENDILITTRGEIGMVAFVPKSLVDSNINAQLVRINGGEKYPKSFLGMSLLSKNVQDDIKSLITGSALQQLPIGKLKTIKIIVPNNLNFILEYDKIVSPLFNKMEENYEENYNLEHLRDRLLPKLMNGEIDLDKIQI